MIGIGISIVKPRIGPPETITDPVEGLMTLLRDDDGLPIKDDDGKYIYVKVET